jgi:hypothetical protein
VVVSAEMYRYAVASVDNNTTDSARKKGHNPFCLYLLFFSIPTFMSTLALKKVPPDHSSLSTIPIGEDWARSPLYLPHI